MTDQEHGFIHDWKDAGALSDHLNPLPRSVVRPSDYQLLDGEWRFELDLEDRGLQEKWYLGHSFAGTAQWPASVESQLAAAREAQQQAMPAWRDQVIAWYEREFHIPEEWVSDPHSMVQVTFGACGHETRTWLNGHLLVTIEGEPVHYGEYTSFSYELPTMYLQPVNRLTVRIADSLDEEIPRGKQESRVYKRGGIWYQTISGAVRSIWLEPVSRNRLRSRLGVISRIENRMVEFNLSTRVHDPGIYTLRIVVARRGEPQPLVIEEFTLPLEPGRKRQRIPIELPGADLWSPGAPNLYHLVAQLRAPTGTVSQIEAYFGLRNAEARGHAFYLNNEPLYLDGILYQPGTSTFEEMHRHLLAIKHLGCNLVRVHIAGIDPRIYDLADEIGLLLWVEVPSPHRSTPQSRINHEAELMRLLIIIASHPSVVICSLYNESWGAEDIGSNPETQHYVARMYDFLRLNYPEILVVDNDGWQHVSTEGALESHLLTAHLYTSNQDEWRDRLDRLVQGDDQGVTFKPLVVGDPFFYRGQLPLVVSEWGGFGFEAYQGPTDFSARAARIRAFKRDLRAREIAGDVYTQATSIEDENNGLIDSQSGELLVPPGLLGLAP